MAVITGSNRGTGRAIAESLRDAQWQIASMNRTVLGARWLEEYGCDLSDPDDVVDKAQSIADKYDKVDAFVATAATRNLATVADLTVAAFNEALMVNLASIVHATRILLPSIRRAQGRIVVIGSHSGSYYFEGGTSYSATKAALKAFVETLLLEERANGVKTTLVSPGAIANFEWDHCPYKMTTESVARCVTSLITNTPEDVAVGEIEIRPANIPSPDVSGLERLRFI